MIVPGRFTVSHTDIANPDYMQLQLATIDLLRGYCSRAEGTYRVEENAFAAGTPDLPVKPIEVKAAAWGTKAVSWEYPYSKFTMVGYVPQMHYSCKFVDKSEFETYRAQLAVVTGGTSSLMMFDCSHQLVDLTGDRGTMLYQTKPGSPVHDFYLKVCKAVTGEAPYLRSE